MKEITTEIVNTFLSGHDPMEHIISIECAWNEDQVSIIYVDDNGIKRIKKDDFKAIATYFVEDYNKCMDELGIDDGETTEDGLFSLKCVACLGCCSLSPVMMINGKTYSTLTPDKCRKVLREIAKEEGGADA